MFVGGPGFFAASGSANDPFWASVVLLVQGDGASIDDVSTPAHTMTANGAGTAVTSSAPRFGAGAITIPTPGGTVFTPANSDFTFGTSSDFTIEVMARVASLAAVRLYMGIEGAGSNRYAIGSGTADSSKFALWFNGSSILESATGVLTAAGITTGFVHLAWTRASGTTRLFVNGALVATDAADTRNYTGTSNFRIGEVNTSSNGLDRFDLARVTKGVARYTAAFTPPSAAFPTS